MSLERKNIVLIPAAGVGSRFGSDKPKQYVSILGKTVLAHTVAVFLANERIHEIVVVVSPEDTYAEDLFRDNASIRVCRVGGETRAQTVSNGLNYLLDKGLMKQEDVILVHDAARCCLPQAALNRLLDAACEHPHGGILAIPVADTLKRQRGDSRSGNLNVIEQTVAREGLWQAQTPQLFRADLLKKALDLSDLAQITDEASAVENLGVQPILVQGDTRNIKLTRPDDVHYVAWCLERNLYDNQ